MLNLIYAVFVEVGVKAGLGRHPYYLGPAQTSVATHWSTIAFTPGPVAFAVPKLSVAILLARLLNPSKVQRYIMYTLSIATTIGSCLVVILLWHQCSPAEKLWIPTIEAKCWNPDVLQDCTIAHGSKHAVQNPPAERHYVVGVADTFPIQVCQHSQTST